MKALDATKILINLSLDNQKPITNLKLQKMLLLLRQKAILNSLKNIFKLGIMGLLFLMFIVIFVSMDQPQSLKERKYRII